MSAAFEVPDALDGERVDRAVATLTGYSRAEISALCERGEVLVEGRTVARSRRLVGGETVELVGEPPATSLPGPDPAVALDVRYEDADVIVVNKRAGLVVHPGAGHPDATMVNGLLAEYPELAGVGDPARPGIVHRLDRDTSGLMVVARSSRAYAALVQQLGTRSVRRDYEALVWGHLDAPRGVIDAPIGRSTARRTRMAVRDGGRDARTRYEVRGQFDAPAVSLLEVGIETGRTHQIRVHLAAIGHPVVGDPSYGGRRQPLALDRPFLHAARLGFRHPVTGEHLQLESALPPELRAALETLGPAVG